MPSIAADGSAATVSKTLRLPTPDCRTDEALVEAVRAGSDAAFAEIVRRYELPLCRYCARIVGPDRAHDAVQQAFLNAFVALRRDEAEPILLAPWLRRIAYHAAIDIVREPRHEELSVSLGGGSEPADALERKEVLATVVGALLDLPASQRRALLMREAEGRSYDEIAPTIGQSRTGIHQLIFRGRTKLRSAVAAACVPLFVALAPLAAAPEAASAAAKCKNQKPRALTFKRAVGATTGTLSWKSPKRTPSGASGYRVYRNKDVVGQTRSRRMRIRVAPGKRYRFAVRVALRSGGVAGCAARMTKRLRYRRPGRPVDLAISDVRQRGVTLTWSASRRGDSEIAAYRVFRDGRTVHQVKTLSTRVPLPSAGRYEVAVAAVDRSGRLGKRSESATVVADHRPPAPPSGLNTPRVTDTGITLAWSAGPASHAEITGYRVLRDAAVLRQVGGTSVDVDGLAPATSYPFAVVAVDEYGYLSEPSPVLDVRTSDPPATRGRVHAFLLATTDQSFADFRAHYEQIGTVYPTYYQCEADGSISGEDDPLVSGWAKLRRVKVLPRLNCQSPTRLHRIFTNPETRAYTIERMVSAAREHGYDGINLDFEAGLASDRDELTRFVEDIGEALHRDGRLVAVEASPKTWNTTTGRSGFFDYPDLAHVADTIFVMNWGIHWATSAPGPIDDLSWATKVADYVATMPNRSRFVLGTPLYGMDWPNGGGSQNPATALEYADMQELIARVGAVPRFDTPSWSPHFEYTDAGGTPHEVWYTDARSTSARIELARSRGLGIGFWRLGEEDQRVWSDPLLAPGADWP